MAASVATDPAPSRVGVYDDTSMTRQGSRTTGILLALLAVVAVIAALYFVARALS